MEYILGVDGGGSRSTVLIADLNGKEISRVESGASNYKSIGKKKAIENLNKGIFKAISKLNSPEEVYFKSSCFGFAGNDAGKDFSIYKEIVFNSELSSYLNPEKTIICNDTKIGIEAGSDSKNKIIIIAGTGSNCFGVNEKGKSARASGWDYILSDEGSGYSVGQAALKAVMKAYDGRGKKTLLSKTILEELKLKEVLDLPGWAYESSFSKAKISALAKVVCITANMGDKISIDILAGAAEEAVLTVSAVIEKLELEDKSFDLYFVGGLFKCEKYFKNVLMDKLKERFSKINFIPHLADPVKGAIKLAIKNLKN
jgi:N-acetylglucosamine kinase-like BadF-type ATPase